MHVYFMPLVIRQHEVPFAIFPDLPVALRGENLSQPSHIAAFKSDVQVLVRSGLPAEQRIDGPAAVDPHPDAHFFECRIVADDLR